MNTLIKPHVLHKSSSNALTLVTFLLAIFMGALDHGIVGPALSSINTHFQISASWGVWSFTIYTLFFAVSIPIMGKFSDRYGRKLIFTTGISLFAVGSLVSAIAPSFSIFLVGRAIQAIGTGGIFPITAAQIAATYPPEERGKYLGYIGVVFGLGSILGPVIGGGIIGYFQWQWIFFINIPISIIILFLLSKVRVEQQVMKKPIDFRGIGLLTLTIMSFMLGITLENIWLIVLGLCTSIVMVFVEKTAVDPIMKIQLFTQRNTLFILILSLASGFIMATAINLLPLFSEEVLGLDKGTSGIGVTPLAVSSMVASLVGGLLIDKVGPKKVLLLGFIVSLIGAILLANYVSNLLTFIVTILIFGFGIGIIIGAPLNVMIMQNIPLHETGAAVGFVSLFRSLGSTIGPTIAGAILTVFNNDFTLVYMINSVFSILSLVLIFSLKKRNLQEA